ncbi:MAG: right-handed parallel beta-helix repeat-containing protein, partial [bacterium]
SMKCPDKFFLGCLVGLVFGAAPLAAHDYFVALDGNDSNAGTLARPFRSLDHATHALKPGDTLYFRKGTYRHILYAEASGTASAPIVFCPYKHETVVLAGSDPLQGVWKRWHGKIWRMQGAPLASDLFLDGQELSGARWPAVRLGAPMQDGWAVAGKGTTTTAVCDPALPETNLSGAGIHIIPGLGWVGFTRTIRSSQRGKLFFQAPLGGPPAYTPRPGNLYYLYGSLALLDSPGQWYQDSSTGDLYLWTPDGQNPAVHGVEIGRRKLVALDKGFSYVDFRGFYTFCGAVKISGCRGCRVLGLNQRYVQHFTSVQGYSCEPPTNGIYQGLDCEWADGSIAGSSGDGLAVSGSGDHVHHMVIQNVCESGSYTAAIALRGSDHLIEDNTCHDSGRYLIELGDARGGAVQHNDLYRAGLLTKDVGAIYSYRCDGGGMVIAYNDIHDVAATRGIGIYLDNGDSDYVVHHNLVRDCAWSALELNLPSWNNRIYNNTFWDCRHWVWADGAPHSMTGTVLENNLYNGTGLWVHHRLAPFLRDNATFLQPPALFKHGSFQLAQGSPAAGRAIAAPPYTNGWTGAGPDLGAFAYGIAAWSAGCASPLAPFPYLAVTVLAEAGGPAPRARHRHWW